MAPRRQGESPVPIIGAWKVRLTPLGPTHAMVKITSLVTMCGVDFAGRDGSYELKPVTCQHCLEVIGCLPPEV